MQSEPLRRLGYARSVSILNTAFRQAPLGVWTHVLGRFLSCPFLRTFRWIPAGRILDVGGGHGVFAQLAVEAGAEEVTIAEPDLEKLMHGARTDGIVRVGAYVDAIRGRFDAVTMFDVLYRIPLEERDGLFSSLVARLEPGGVLLIKDLDPTSRLKFTWNRVQELISDNLLGLTLGSGLHYETPHDVLERMRRAGLADLQSVRIDRGYPHSHVVCVGYRQADQSS